MTVATVTDLETLARAAAATGLVGATFCPPTATIDDDTWGALLGRCRVDRSTGLLLEAIDGGSWPATDAQRADVLALHTNALAESLVLERTLLDVARLLTESGIPLRVLKGAAVAHLDYPEPGERTFGDVDLLVPAADVERVGELIGGQRLEPPARPGFDRQFGKSATYRIPSGHELDVHRTLALGPYGLSVHLPDLWDGGQALTLGGQELTALSDEARLMHTSYACVLSDFPARAHPKRDLAEMILFGTYSPALVIDMARRWRAEAVLATAVTETWAHFGLADVTALTAWAEAYPVSQKDQRLLALYRRPDAPYARLALHSLPLIEGWGSRWTFTRSLAFPDQEFLRGRGMSLPAYLWRGSRRALGGGAR